MHLNQTCMCTMSNCCSEKSVHIFKIIITLMSHLRRTHTTSMLQEKMCSFLYRTYLWSPLYLLFDIVLFMMRFNDAAAFYARYICCKRDSSHWKGNLMKKSNENINLRSIIWVLKVQHRMIYYKLKKTNNKHLSKSFPYMKSVFLSALEIKELLQRCQDLHKRSI